MRILAVDDDPLLVEMLQLMLPTAGFPDVEVAFDGYQALEILEKQDQPFDLFLLDIQMPGMDGVELCARIQAQSRYENTPKIMLTAMSEIDYINRAFDAGAIDYITKPFEFQDIQTRLKLVEARTRPAPREPEKPVDRAAMLAAPIPDLPQIRFHLQPDVLDNYLASLGRLNLLLRDFYLVSIEDFPTAVAGCAPYSHFDLVEEICHEFSTCILGGEAFFSYIGNGEFVFAFNGKLAAVDDEFSQRLGHAFEIAWTSINGDFAPKAGPLTLSALVKPSIFADPKLGALDALITRLRKARRRVLSLA